MLARVAETLYWMARYLERAENMARLINVNANLIFDTPKKTVLGWKPLIEITGTQQQYDALHSDYSEQSVLKYLIKDADSPSSIANSLAWARENARTIRDVIPREAWEQINSLNHFARDNMHHAFSVGKRFDYLNEIITRNQTISGLLSGTLNHDQGYVFLRLGRNLERADMTSRIIDVRSANLLGSDTLEQHPYENIQWMSVLKSLTAYQMYRQSMQARIRRADVMRFLFKSERFPRAIVFCLHQMMKCIDALPSCAAATEKLKALKTLILTADLPTYDQAMLHQFVDQVQIDLSEIHRTLSAQYFLSSRMQAAATQLSTQSQTLTPVLRKVGHG